MRVMVVVELSAEYRIRDESDVLKYYWNFLTIALPLLEDNKLTDNDFNAEFFKGFHLDGQDILADQVFNMIPRHPTNQPFDIQDVLSAACNTSPAIDSQDGSERTSTAARGPVGETPRGLFNGCSATNAHSSARNLTMTQIPSRRKTTLPLQNARPTRLGASVSRNQARPSPRTKMSPWRWP